MRGDALCNHLASRRPRSLGRTLGTAGGISQQAARLGYEESVYELLWQIVPNSSRRKPPHYLGILFGDVYSAKCAHAADIVQMPSVQDTGLVE